MKDLVARVQAMLAEHLGLPEGYEIALGVGGSTAFWDAAAFSLVRERAQHLSFGEFGSKFAKATDQAPFLAPSDIRTSEPGTRPEPEAVAARRGLPLEHVAPAPMLRAKAAGLAAKAGA